MNKKISAAIAGIVMAVGLFGLSAGDAQACGTAKDCPKVVVSKDCDKKEVVSKDKDCDKKVVVKETEKKDCDKKVVVKEPCEKKIVKKDCTCSNTNCGNQPVS